MPRGRKPGTVYAPGAGRKPLPLDRRKPGRSGKITIEISPECASLAQRLMLHFPLARNVEALFAHALERLAATTDD